MSSSKSEKPGASNAQTARSIGYLGPEGTFTEQALFTQPDLAAMQHFPINDILAVLKATQNGEVDLGFVAIENMIEGSVTATIDALAFDTDLMIQREVIIGINLNLLVVPGVSASQIEVIRTYPIAKSQCRSYIAERFPGARVDIANSTADAASELAGSGAENVAVIAPQRSAEVYGLEVLEADIEDHPENKTRFVLVGRESIVPPTGHDKTSLVVYQQVDQPGSLLGLLAEFAARSVNLTSLQSRPTRENLGQYCFLIDCEGHITDDVVADALRSVHMRAASVKLLGSYPSAYGTAEVQQAKRAGVTSAEQWVETHQALVDRQLG